MAKYVSGMYQPEKFASDDEDEDDLDIAVEIQEPPEGPIISATDSESEAEAENGHPDGGGAESDVSKSPPEEPRYVSHLPSIGIGIKPSSREMSTRI